MCRLPVAERAARAPRLVAAGLLRSRCEPSPPRSDAGTGRRSGTSSLLVGRLAFLDQPAPGRRAVSASHDGVDRRRCHTTVAAIGLAPSLSLPKPQTSLAVLDRAAQLDGDERRRDTVVAGRDDRNRLSELDVREHAGAGVLERSTVGDVSWPDVTARGRERLEGHHRVAVARAPAGGADRSRPTIARHASARRKRVLPMICSPSLLRAAATPRRAGAYRVRRHVLLQDATVVRREGAGTRRGYDAPPGDVAEWLGRGLQSLVQRFESARRLPSP